MIKSTDEFIEIIKRGKPSGILASLDVESLFTNVPVDDTINIIIDRLYHDPSVAPPKLLPETSMRTLMEICTKEAPFSHIDGSVYRQIDGIAMGSPLSCTMANFFMCHHENKVLEHIKQKPAIYCRYVDDIFVCVDGES